MAEKHGRGAVHAIDKEGNWIVDRMNHDITTTDQLMQNREKMSESQGKSIKEAGFVPTSVWNSHQEDGKGSAPPGLPEKSLKGAGGRQFPAPCPWGGLWRLVEACGGLSGQRVHSIPGQRSRRRLCRQLGNITRGQSCLACPCLLPCDVPGRSIQGLQQEATRGSGESHSLS